jgi:hypothetical protein
MLYPKSVKQFETTEEDRVRIGATILSLMLIVGLSLAAQSAATDAPANPCAFSSLLRPSEDILSPGSSPQTDPPGDTLHVDLEAFNNAVGLTAGGIFYTAARLTPTVACTVATVIFYKWNVSNDDYLFVWGAGTSSNPGAVIESIPYSGATTMAWQSIDLLIQVPLAAGEDIWVGPRMNHAAGTYPLGVDDGPAVAGRGGWINYQGSWEELVGVGLDMNWHIRAILGHGGLPACDVGVNQILAPGSIVTPGSIQPKAKIRNYGTDPQSNIPVTCWIDSGATRVYTASANYAGPLAPGATADVPFSPNWPAVGGTYNVTMFTSLGGDLNAGNDTMRGQTQVMTYTIDWTQPSNVPTEGVSRVAVCTDPAGNVHVICGNCQTHTSHPTDQIYDPVANTWSVGLTHPAGGGLGVHNHDAVAINDVIWCGGGSSGSAGFYNNLTKLDLGGGTWTSVGAMPVSNLIYYVMEEYADSGWVYVLGGSPSGTAGPLDSCWRYKTTTGTWDRMANMPGGRRNMMTARFGDTIYVIGGMSANDYTSTRGTVWKYSVLGNTWRAPTADTMPDKLGWGKAVAYTATDGQNIYVFGGYRAGAIVNACWRYDVSAGAWHADHTMMTATRSMGADIHENVVWAVGGYGASILANVQKGTIALVGVEEGSKVQVGSSHKAYPTLARGLVRISYSLSKAARVNLGIYDASGALVRTLVDGAVGPGARTATWNRSDQSGRRVASGTYFYRLSVDGKSVSGKSVIVN